MALVSMLALCGLLASSRLPLAHGRRVSTGEHRELVNTDVGPLPASKPVLARLHYGHVTAQGKAVHWDMYRQGHKIFEGSDVSYDFNADDLYKQFLANVQITNKANGRVDTTCVVPIYVRPLNSSLCGVEVFSKPKLACDRATPSVVKDALAYAKFAPKTDRGFSLEFEFVGRDILPEHWKTYGEKVRQLIMSEKFTDHGHPLEYVGNVSNLTEWEKILSVRECFQDSIDNPKDLETACSSDADCAITQYCMNCDECLTHAAKARSVGIAEVTGKKDICDHCSPAGRTCKPREACEGSADVDCPPVLSRWNWEKDGSVSPLTEEEVEMLGAPSDNALGSPFEMTAPGPPHVLSGPQGMRGVMEVLTMLQNMGTQAGPSQGLHVHVNVASDAAPGALIPIKGVAAVWAAWGKYQLVIAEMLSPGRLNNYYAKMHVFGDCALDDKQDTCKEDPCPCTKRFFMQMHGHLRQLGAQATGLNYTKDALKDFCNAVLRLPGGKLKKPCQGRYPNQRYFAVNLVALAKFGTVEFRMHSASFDKDRIGRWSQFLVAFVEYFGHGAGKAQMEKFFDNKDWKVDYAELQKAQQSATATEMFDLLEGQIDKGTRAFYEKREWEERDPMCEVPAHGKYTKVLLEPDCDIREDVINPATRVRSRAQNHIHLTGDGRFVVSNEPAPRVAPKLEPAPKIAPKAWPAKAMSSVRAKAMAWEGRA